MNNLIGLITGFFIGFFVILLTKKEFLKKMETIKEFLDILIIDTKAKMSRELLSGTPADEIPADIESAIKRYYPKLPPFKKIFNYPVHELIDKVDWTIDPREFFLETDKNEE
jgi:hypothetical protein